MEASNHSNEIFTPRFILSSKDLLESIITKETHTKIEEKEFNRPLTLKIKVPQTPRSSTSEIQALLSSDSPSIKLSAKKFKKRKSITGMESAIQIIKENISTSEFNIDSTDILLRSLQLVTKSTPAKLFNDPESVESIRYLISLVCVVIDDSEIRDIKSFVESQTEIEKLESSVENIIDIIKLCSIINLLQLITNESQNVKNYI